MFTRVSEDKKFNPHKTGGNAIEALIVLQQKTVDLLFLDIRMPQLNGNEFLKTLTNAPKVIFTSAYAEYALEGYELSIVDFLMKPITFERFLKAINKVQNINTIRTLLETNTTDKDNKKIAPFLYFRVDRKMVNVMLHEILYIESMKDYVKVFTPNKTIITKQSISSVEDMLPQNEFIRTHRSFIVSMLKIKSFTTEPIEIDKYEIPIGKLYKSAVR